MTHLPPEAPQDEQRRLRDRISQALRLQGERSDGTFRRRDLRGFVLDGEPVPLVLTQQGIFNPRGGPTLSVVSMLSSPYRDETLALGVWRYAYQSTQTGTNARLRSTMHSRLPIIFFKEIRRGVYVAIHPVHVIDDDPEAGFFTLAVEEVALLPDPLHPDEAQRRYVERVVRQRLHQPEFRSTVLLAYANHCAVCRLERTQLLDAGHIVADSVADGVPHVSNGLALCKIHHAAYDANLLGISPDGIVHIDDELLQIVDGPMLEHGLKGMHKRPLMWVPLRPVDRPDRDRLAQRWEEFGR
jgi:putative restriction endonuclease